MQAQRWLRWTIGGGFAILGVAVAFWVLGRGHQPFKRWLALGVALGCMLPWILWETSFPPPLDLTAYANSVDYEFRDAEYAELFAELNAAALDRTNDDRENGGE